LVSANYQSIAYGEQGPATIDLSIQYDNAIQSPQGTGVGSVVGRTINTLATGAGR